jgi:ferric-dicitrate binding protein FerR (iron transport regulator)
MNESLILKYLHNTCSDEDLSEILVWIRSSERNAAELFELEKIWHSASITRYSSAEYINKAEKALYKRIEKESKKARPTILFSISHRAMRYAAIFIAILVSTSTLIWFGNQYQNLKENIVKVSTTKEIRRLSLPDGTKVWLNKYSSLSYPAKFADNKRDVKLEGEGFFQVVKDKSRPFSVLSQKIAIKVLGTTFNVKSYPKDSIIETSLIEGSIVLSRKDENKDKIILKPGQKAEVNKRNGEMTLQYANVKLDAVWHDGFIPFEKATINEIVSVLEKFYNFKFQLSSNIDTKSRYSGVIYQKSTIDSVLLSLTNTIPFRYKIEDNKVTIYSLR